jgi:lipoyl(octanoyl) transferase|tara:strand:+ start:4329 stop:4961 length:633 start_codon:yes stop_codon:yes gene_type:complete
MSIEIKRSVKPVNYYEAIQLLEKRLEKVINNKANELIWFLEHDEIYTAGTSFNENDILDKSIEVIKTSRGGKISHHSPGQLICYLVIDLTKRNKDIRKFIVTIENSIIETLKEFFIIANSDRKNIGIWVNHDNESKKIAAIGIRVKKWIAYHGFSININNNLNNFNKIIPCGLKNKKVINLKEISKINYTKFVKALEQKLIKNFSVLNYS